jgi:hypothetical protein
MAKTYIPPSEFNLTLEPCDLDAALQAAGAFTDDRGHNFVPAENLAILPGYNMRVHSKGYKERVKWLGEQISREGYDITKPIAVMALMIDGKPVVAVHDGHHRREAVVEHNKNPKAKTPKIAGIPVEFKTDVSVRKMTAGLMLDNSGEPPSPLEASIVVRRLQNDGMKVPDIAKELGITRRWIDDLILLSSATEVIQQAMIDGEISPTTVIDELRTYAPLDVEKRFVKAQKEVKPNPEGRRKVTAKSLSKVVAKKKEKRASPKGTTTSPTAVADFITLFEQIKSEREGNGFEPPYMEIAFAGGVGYAATILSESRDTNPGAETLAQGVGETAAEACEAASKHHADALIEAAAADL